MEYPISISLTFLLIASGIINAQDCVDKHPLCKSWFVAGKCSSGNKWINRFCCDSCTNGVEDTENLSIGNEPTKPQDICEAVLDIGFVLDSSGSIRYQYKKEKTFVKSLAAAFDISEKGSHAGVITFSSEAVISIRLNDYKDEVPFNAAVDRIPLMGKYTRIDKALLLAKDKFYLPENGGRDGIPKLLIFLTDGTQTNDDDALVPSEIADQMREMGISVLAIGMGSRINYNELASIGGGNANAYNVTSFRELAGGNFVSKMKKSSCSTVSEEKKKRSFNMDVGFLLDSSGSLRYNYGEEKDFLKSLASRLNISEQGPNCGVITFSNDAVLSIKLNEFDDQESFNAAVDNIPLMKKFTRIDKALQLAKEDFFLPENGGRDTIPKLLILITDGTQTNTDDSQNPAVIADEIRKKGIQILVIGIGPMIDPKELAAIGGGEENWFNVPSFSELSGNNYEYLDVVLKAIR